MNERTLYLLDLDGFLVVSRNPYMEKLTNYLTMDYVLDTGTGHLVKKFLNDFTDVKILTARHPRLKKQISDMFFGWDVICRDFDLDIEKINKRDKNPPLNKWMKRVVKFKTSEIKKLSKKYDHIYFYDDDKKLYEKLKIKGLELR